MSFGLVALGAPSAQADADSSWLSFTSDSSPDLCMTAEGSKVRLRTCNGTDPQVWYWNGGTFQIINKATRQCLGIEGGSVAGEKPLVAELCQTRRISESQRWWYHNYKGTTIDNYDSEKVCVDVPSSDFKDGKELQAYNCNGTDAQKWNADWPKTVDDKEWLRACAQGYYPGNSDNTATCEYVNTSYQPDSYPATRVFVGNTCDADTPLPQTPTYTWSNSRTGEDSVSVTTGLTAETGAVASLFAKVSVKLESSYGHKWTQSHTYGGSVPLNINKHMKLAAYHVGARYMNTDGYYKIVLKYPVSGVNQHNVSTRVHMEDSDDAGEIRYKAFNCNEEPPATLVPSMTSRDLPIGVTGGGSNNGGESNGGNNGGNSDGQPGHGKTVRFVYAFGMREAVDQWGGNTANGSRVYSSDYVQGNQNQQWVLWDKGNGQYLIEKDPQRGGQVLDTDLGNHSVNLWHVSGSNGADNQRWTFTPSRYSSSAFTICAVNGGCLRTDGPAQPLRTVPREEASLWLLW
ncbi:RICIN domain-containing protein [Streptomyces gamaensis]|uniref:RICIN domain-containing protein n=1 Tax=Streptomyces gamaensis TaxID=1763542 RepID=A0ABW0ZCF8_9ACTN